MIDVTSIARGASRNQPVQNNAIPSEGKFQIREFSKMVQRY